MAGVGSRLRPHTLTVPKPLTVIAGKPIVQRLVEDISSVINEKIDEIAFIIGPLEKGFPANTKEELLKIAKELGSKGSVYVQEEALGTAHALFCAKDSLSGPCVVAYADTLISANLKLDPEADAVIWVKQVNQPEAFGVVDFLLEHHRYIRLIRQNQDCPLHSELTCSGDLLRSRPQLLRYCGVVASPALSQEKSDDRRAPVSHQGLMLAF